MLEKSSTLRFVGSLTSAVEIVVDQNAVTIMAALIAVSVVLSEIWKLSYYTGGPLRQTKIRSQNSHCSSIFQGKMWEKANLEDTCCGILVCSVHSAKSWKGSRPIARKTKPSKIRWLVSIANHHWFCSMVETQAALGYLSSKKGSNSTLSIRSRYHLDLKGVPLVTSENRVRRRLRVSGLGWVFQWKACSGLKFKQFDF